MVLRGAGAGAEWSGTGTLLIRYPGERGPPRVGQGGHSWGGGLIGIEFVVC